jgi:CRP-like cAMP-binding protein
LLFRAGSPASHFYILIKGNVKLKIGEDGHVVYIVSKAGEAFGWSSLIDRDVYSATAECSNPTNLLKFERQELQKVLENDSKNGLIFFKRLAMILGNRLLQSYDMISSAAQAELTTSFGTGQVLVSDATEL